ncbi:hypothetical protein ACX3VT_04270 [Aerococcus sanguinicola]|uniref:hypothetical protein n=2 Tax=Aerococcus TaxID=1375 RepID=UPI0008A4CBD6|nr:MULTISPECIES: hypothetical protein [unclassified Aerococcus]KAB0645261.1 hypothetical protein F6I01_11935 [Aerococcus sanguinicola]MDK6234367.1 hypothetical protein [Aerococcus sp. UMB10185]MDK6856200.1 hypothetical protein [Aerococcus sp. UMB7533]OFN00998.1 hypothetical protein HMPREF2626_03055 [Aerococcus sp. HMSC062A02]OHO43956.1 hypothetical protein HMPREF2705_07420 [Aerococcus sp. HMSC035B07]
MLGTQTLVANFSVTEDLEALYKRAKRVKTLNLREQVVYLHYQADADRKAGRTLVVCSDGSIFRTQSKPEILIQNYSERMAKEQFFHQKLTKKPFQPVVSADLIFVPLKSVKRGSPSWLALHQVYRLPNLKEKSRHTIVEGMTNIHLTLDVRPSRFIHLVRQAYLSWVFLNMSVLLHTPKQPPYFKIEDLENSHLFQRMLYTEASDQFSELYQTAEDIHRERYSEQLELWHERVLDFIH